MKKTKKTIIIAVVAFMGVGPALAAEITNGDAMVHTLRITENGQRSEVVIDPGQTIVVCEDGCFMTAPNGGLLAIEGDETITLTESAAVVQ